MELSKKTIIEAALFSQAEPLDLEKLKVLTDADAEEVKRLLLELENDYQERGVNLVKVASGYRFQVPQKFSAKIAVLTKKNPPKYTQAFLETLALIVYRQPITRGEIEEVRGVAVNTKIMKTLQEREWIKVIGHRDVPGKPALFATTKQFLDYFCLNSLSDLPPLEDIIDLEKLEEKFTEQLTLAALGHKGEIEPETEPKPKTANQHALEESQPSQDEIAQPDFKSELEAVAD